ncbi:MAG: hypothetical protein IID46_02215 [Planctomycetes bacterium]|nr:hypothetical protein [Planctomycetota bacterium]
MMQINAATSLSSASQTAVGAIRSVTREAQQVANNVNAAATNEPNESGEPVSEIASEIARLPALKNRLAANVQVVNTNEDLLDELGSLLLKR